MHIRTVTCSCEAQLTEFHKDVCPVYDDLIQGEISHESPSDLLARQQQSEADKLEAAEKAAAKAAEKLKFKRPAAYYKRPKGRKKIPINPMAAALNAAFSNGQQ
jgi:hypothetical protein